MSYVIAQLSDSHIGGPDAGSSDRFSAAIDEINAMTRQPDLVLLTGDLTNDGTAEQWAEATDRLKGLRAKWEAVPGNHDRGISDLAGNRSITRGPLQLILLDTSADIFTPEDAEWLDAELAEHTDVPVAVAVHQPPFDTGIWWMDCLKLQGSELLEEVVRRHPQVIKVFSGHVHRAVQTNWGGCSLWVCPSTSVAVTCDLDPAHDPAQSGEGPMFSLHLFTGDAFVSHLVPVGQAAQRTSLREAAPEFVDQLRATQRTRNDSLS